MVVSKSFWHTALSGSQFKATGFTGGYLLLKIEINHAIRRHHHRRGCAYRSIPGDRIFSGPGHQGDHIASVQTDNAPASGSPFSRAALRHQNDRTGFLCAVLGHYSVLQRHSAGYAGRRMAGDPEPGRGTHGFKIGTTHTITGSIMGVGATKRLSAVRWNLATHTVWAWILTIPCTMIVSALIYSILKLFI